MGWQKMLQIPKGHEADYDPDELKSELKDVEPIVEISEVVRPRLAVSIDLPGGMNVLASVCYHREKMAYQLRMRLRDSKGMKTILKPSNWKQLDIKAVEHQKGGLIERFETFAKETGGKARKIEFGPEATNEEIIKGFVSSGIFDVLKIDSKLGKVKKLA